MTSRVETDRGLRSYPQGDPESPFLQEELFARSSEADWEAQLAVLEAESPFLHAFEEGPGAITEPEFGELYSESNYPVSNKFDDSEVSDKPTADAFVADNDGKEYFVTFPQLGDLAVKKATILTPSNFENLMDLMLASNQKNFVIDAHGEPKGLFMPLTRATKIAATKHSLFILTGIEYIQSLIRTAKESDTFWGRASGTDVDRWRRIVEVLHSKTWQQMVGSGWPTVTPQVSSVDAAKIIIQSRINSLVDSLFPGKIANKQDRVDRLIKKMLRLQSKGIREIQFRACNIGKDSNTLFEFRKFFGADHLCAPDVRSGMGYANPSINRRAVDRLGQDHRTQVFNMPSGRFAIRIIISGSRVTVNCAADTQAAVGEWVASHIMANFTHRRGKLPIHFLQTQPLVFPLDSDYAAHIQCRSSFWEGVVRGSEKHRQEIEAHKEREEKRAIAKPEIEKYDEYIDKLSEEQFEEELEGKEFAEFIPDKSGELEVEDFGEFLDEEGEFEEEDATMPVLSLDKLKIDGLPEITLTLGSSGQYEGFFREPPSSYNGSVKLSGRVQIEEAGTRRGYDYERDRSRWPFGKAWAHVGVGGAIGSSGAGFSPVKRDGTFTTSTWIGYKPHLVRRLAIQVIVESKNGKRFGAKVVVELIDLAGFLGIVDPKEKTRPSWQTHLQFLASVRKIYHGGPREPQFVGPFSWVLYRHRDVDPLFDLNTPAEQRLRLYKILYDNGEWLEIGHVLCGIEGSPKQEPDKVQSVPKPLRPELIVTWSGDLGSALQAFIQHFWLATDKEGNALDKDDPLNLNHYLVKEASRSDLIGDIDGINVGSAYDSSRSLAENLNAYYGKKSRRRYHEFIANSKNERGIAELPLVQGKKPPKLSKQSRQTIAYYTNLYLTYLQLQGKLYLGTEPAKRKRVDDIIRIDSPEMENVVDYFVRFLEDGLTLEQRQGILSQPEVEESDEFLDDDESDEKAFEEEEAITEFRENELETGDCHELSNKLDKEELDEEGEGKRAIAPFFNNEWEPETEAFSKFLDELDEEEPDEEIEEEEKPENKFENCSNLQKNRIQTVSNWARDAVTRAATVVGNVYGRPDRMSPRTRQVLNRHFRITDRDHLREILLGSVTKQLEHLLFFIYTNSIIPFSMKILSFDLYLCELFIRNFNSFWIFISVEIT